MKHAEGGIRMRVRFVWSMICLAVGMFCLSVVPGFGEIAAPHLAADKKDGGAPHAILKTKFGEMEIVLFPELAPKHVASFMKLAKSGFYNGTIFHRVIPGFMIQGGDPNTKDPNKRREYGMGGPGYTLPAEFNRVRHERGILSAARTADPNSAGSQFFLMVNKAPHLDGQYTVFGEVIKGIEISDQIVNQPRDPRDMPLERIEITIEIIE